MTLQPRSSGVWIGDPPDDTKHRSSLWDRARGGVSTAALCVATGLGAMLWTGHHALGQSRVTLRATIEHEDQPLEARRAALEALVREAQQDLQRIRELAEADAGKLSEDARNYLQRLTR